MSLFTWLTSCLKKENEQTTGIQADRPVSFGYKCVWITVNATDPKEVADFLKLKNQRTSTWKLGIDGAYSDKIFISPVIDSLVFIIGITLPSDSDEIKKMISALSKRFGKADYFATHRVTEFHCWMKSIQGDLKRAYSYLGERGENLIVDGEPTEFEKRFDLVNTFSKEYEGENYFEKEGLKIPNEEFVMQLAGDWGINPTTLEERTDLKRGLGIIGKR
jgi:hypothetical protein